MDNTLTAQNIYNSGMNDMNMGIISNIGLQNLCYSGMIESKTVSVGPGCDLLLDGKKINVPQRRELPYNLL